MSNPFRIFTRATTTGFFTPSCTSHSTARQASTTASRKMSVANELFQAYGPTVFKTLAVAGVSGALISRFMVSKADAEAPPGVAMGKKVFGRAGPVFTRFKLESSEDVNHNTKKLSFKLPGDGDISGLPLTCEFSLTGHFQNHEQRTDNLSIIAALVTVAWPKGQTLPVLRPYTPISPSDQTNTVDFLVKRYPQGKQSTHLHSLHAGDSVLFAFVIPGYKWTPNQHASLTLIAGGAGITPCYQLIQGILSNPDDRTKVRLVFGVNAEEDVLLRRELEDFEARYGRERFRVVYAVGSGGASVDGGRFRKGFVTEDLVKEVAAAPAGDKSTKVMVCGPPAMEEALLGKKGWGARQEGILARLGYSKEQIHQF